MDIRGVERYILLGYDNKKAAGYKIRSRQLGFGFFWCLVATLILIGILEIRLHSSPESIFGYTLQFALHPVVYIITALMICLVALLVFNISGKRINKLFGRNDEAAFLLEKSKKRGRGIAVAGGTAGLLGAGLSRTILEYRPDLHWASGVIAIIFLVMVMLFFAFLYLYKYYLIKKYCPYLRYYHDGQYLDD